MSLLSKLSSIRIIPYNTTTTQKVKKNFLNEINHLNILSCFFSHSLQIVLVSLTAGVVLLSVLARYLGRRKTPRPIRRPRIVSGRRTRNSMRSPNGKSK